MKNKVLSLVSIYPLLLASCGGSNASVAAYKNAELNLNDEITADNAFLRGDYEAIDSMIKAEESFIFYLTNKDCYSCQNFAPVMLEYVKNTKRAIYKLDVSNDEDELVRIGKDYEGFFFMGGQVVTPQVYVFSIEKACQFVKNSRYENIGMFTRAMNEYVYESNVYQISSFASYNYLKENNSEFYFYMYDRVDTNSTTIFKDEVKTLIDKTKKTFFLIDYQKLSEEDIASFKVEYNTDLSYPLAGHYCNSEFSYQDGKEKGLISTFFSEL